MSAAPRRPLGPGRVLAFGYGLFVVAAGSRAIVQLGSHAGRAPLAYGLSAFAACVYIAGLVLLLRVDRSGRGIGAARALCVAELTGVITVGTASLIWADHFPEATVWSHFGSGYSFVPVVLPLLGLSWLRHITGRDEPQTAPLSGDRSPTATQR
jgi:hypothetical protein